MNFSLLPLRFHLRAVDRIRFAPGMPGNILRGAFGEIVNQMEPEAHARLFAPRATAGPSGLADPPRPFVFRAHHLDGLTVQPGDAFHFDVNLFDIDTANTAAFIAVFSQLAVAGLGPGRGRATLEGADVPDEPLCIPLEAGSEPVPRLAIDFLSPTELKPVNRPDFAVLLARVRDRVSNISALYGEGPLPLDFKLLGELALEVRTTRTDLQYDSIERHSSRTGQTHPIGGFTGTAEYEGELAVFLPLLKAAVHTGVGRHTVWGNGSIALRV